MECILGAKKVIQQKALFLIFLSLEESGVGRGGGYDGIKSYFFRWSALSTSWSIWFLLRFWIHYLIPNILYWDFGSTIRSQISSNRDFGRWQISFTDIWDQIFDPKYPLLRFWINYSVTNILFWDLGASIRSQISSIEIWKQQFDHKYPLLRFGINYSIPNILYWDLGTTIRSQISFIEIWDQLFDPKYPLLRFGNNNSIPNILYWDLGSTIRSQISDTPGRARSKLITGTWKTSLLIFIFIKKILK